MAAGQIPQPEWFDMGDELDRIATEGTRSLSALTLNYAMIYLEPFVFIAGLVREDENWSWPSDPSTAWNPFGEYLLQFVERVYLIHSLFADQSHRRSMISIHQNQARTPCSPLKLWTGHKWYALRSSPDNQVLILARGCYSCCLELRSVRQSLTRR